MAHMSPSEECMGKVSQSRDIALYLEKLRFSRGISQEDFLFDIVSIRQFRRYASGDSEMPYNILDKLSEKLGFTAEYIIMELEVEKQRETQKINNFYNAASVGNKTLFNDLLAEIDKKHILLPNNKLLYQHAKNWFNYKQGNLSDKAMLSITKDLIGLDKVLKKNVLSTSELIIMVSFLQLNDMNEKYEVATKLSSYVEHQFVVISGHNIRTVVLVLEELAKYYYGQDNYDRMLYYTNEAIRYSISMRSFYLLDYLYTYQAVCYNRLSKLEQRDEAIQKCIYVLKIENNPNKIDNFRGILEKRFDLDIKNFLK